MVTTLAFYSVIDRNTLADLVRNFLKQAVLRDAPETATVAA